jgi:chromosome segregation ATPase
MSRGITQSDVFAAADTLLAAGERPTVERIRTTLGSGSPNTVVRHLDAWWSDAGRRLRSKAELPDVPGPVAELTAALWAQAVDAATSMARAEFDRERQGLDTEREAFVTQQANAAEHTRVQQGELAHTRQHAAALETQLASWEARAANWEAERERMHAESERLAALMTHDRNALEALRHAHELLQRQLEQDRLSAVEHIRLVEDRAHAMVDTVRQEMKALRQNLVAAQRDAARQEAILARERASHAKALSAAEREGASARAKAQATEQALAAFRVALQPGQRAAVSKATPRKRTRKAAPG